MFLGMVCCMVNLYAVNGSSTGPLRQFRFCSSGYNDSLSYSENPINIVEYSWNDTVRSSFENQGPSNPSCICPCLNAMGLLRQPGDLRAIEFLNIQPPSPLYWGLNVVSAIIYGCIPLSILFCFTILLLRLRGHKSTRWGFNMIQMSEWKTKFPHFTLWAINIYGKILTPFVFVVFLVWVEWVITYDLQSEPMQLVGQWAPLVGAALVLIAAVVGRYWFEVAKLWRRATVRSCLIDESIWGSFKYVWNRSQDYNSKSLWNQVGVVYFQNFDGD
jgi:hypothetical protein